MRHLDEKSKFLKILEDRPFISYAAKAVGIAKSTIYRWLKSDKDFRKSVDKALSSGRSAIVDLAEMALVKKVQDGETNAIRFLLTHNSERYRPKMPIIPKTMPERLQPGETCDHCGTQKPIPVSNDFRLMLKEAMRLYYKQKRELQEQERLKKESEKEASTT